MTSQPAHLATTAHLVPEGHPAHSLLSVAHALLCPASAIANPSLDKQTVDLTVLPIDEVVMPETDVSDLRDVVDAINKLCENMKTSSYEDFDAYEDADQIVVDEIDVMSSHSEPVVEDRDTQYVEYRDAQYVECKETQYVELVNPEEILVQKVETYSAERWSDTMSQISLPGQIEDVETVTSDTEPVVAQEPSEMYYTASSEVSLLSDLEAPEKGAMEDSICIPETKEEKKECPIQGHVAAMRERFESMTRANTPCPDLIRSMSPSLDVFRNITPSPDHLDG